MSRRYRTFAFCCVWSVVVPAQSAAQVHVGVQGGIAFSNLSNLTSTIDFHGDVDVKARRAAIVGPFVSVDINDIVAVQIEALFVARGATATDGFNELRIELGYLDIPMLARFTPAGRLPFYGLVGPSVNFNVRARAVDVVPAGEELDIDDDIKAAELAVVFGAGVTMGRGFVEGRYMAGLSNISARRNAAARLRNRGLAILVGARF